MRLIDTTTRRLVYFPDLRAAPQYAILSHTWTNDEVTYQDLMLASSLDGPRYEKIHKTCDKALEQRYKYVWIDTCCIDKSSSAELSEAINSMYAWYRNAAICYIYLADFEGVDADTFDPTLATDKNFHALQECRWFRRGWTLQELLAPQHHIFYDKYWREIGTLEEISETIAEITRIDIEVLRSTKALKNCCIARRMSWAADRETTREEDRAYSLLGIFDVNMPLLYGEGSKAFVRLQEHILQGSTDLSILAWELRYNRTMARPANLLYAPEPGCFLKCSDLVLKTFENQSPVQLSGGALRVRLPVYTDENDKHHAILNCRTERHCMLAIAVVLKPSRLSDDDSDRCHIVKFSRQRRLAHLDSIVVSKECSYKDIIIEPTAGTTPTKPTVTHPVFVRVALEESMVGAGFQLLDLEPKSNFAQGNYNIPLRFPDTRKFSCVLHSDGGDVILHMQFLRFHGSFSNNHKGRAPFTYIDVKLEQARKDDLMWTFEDQSEEPTKSIEVFLSVTRHSPCEVAAASLVLSTRSFLNLYVKQHILLGERVVFARLAVEETASAETSRSVVMQEW